MTGVTVVRLAAPPLWAIPPILALAWGLNWPAVKVMLSALPPFLMRGWGLGGAALLLFVVALARGVPLAPPRGAWRGIVASGLLNVAAFNVCTAFAQLNTSTSRAAVLTYTMPMMTVLMAWALLGERPSRRAFAAMALGGAGLALLAWPAFQGALSWLGIAMPLLAALTWALGTTLSKHWPLQGDKLVNVAWQLAIGAGCATLGVLALAEQVLLPLPGAVWAALAFHIIVANALAYVLWFMLLERTRAGVAALTTLAVPVVGVLGAMWLGGERPTPLDWPGFAGVLAGAALVMLPKRHRD